MSELRPENRALFATARADYEPSGEDRVRVGRALGIGAGAAVAAMASSAAPAAAASGVAPLPVVAGLGGIAAGTWAIVGAVVVAVGAAGATYFAREDTSRSHRPAVERTSTAEAAMPTTAESPLATPPSSSEPVAPVGATTSSPRHAASTLPARHLAAGVDTAAPAPEGGVGLEARLLREADVALRAGDLAAANDRLDEHARAFPSGVLVEERDLERILVLCAGGDREGADTRVAAFLEARPNSILRDRVRSACVPPAASVTDDVTRGH